MIYSLQMETLPGTQMMMGVIKNNSPLLVMRMVCNIDTGVPSTRVDKYHYYWFFSHQSGQYIMRMRF